MMGPTTINAYYSPQQNRIGRVERDKKNLFDVYVFDNGVPEDGEFLSV